MHWKKLAVNLTQMGYLICRIYTTSYFYHSVGLQPLYSKFQYGMNICIKAHKYSPKYSILFRVHPIIHEYSESYTLFWDKNAITNQFRLQPNSMFARNLHWTRGETLNLCKRRWTTTCMDLDKSRLQLR